LAPIENAAGVDADLTICILEAGAVTHQTAHLDSSRHSWIAGIACRAVSATSWRRQLLNSGSAATTSALTCCWTTEYLDSEERQAAYQLPSR
jgi:hypothetical protein